MDVRSMLNPPSSDAALKTPQRTASLAYPPSAHIHPSHSPSRYPPLPRTTSLPAQHLQYREREESLSVSPKTMPSSMPPPPPAPVQVYNPTTNTTTTRVTGTATPSPVMSRKRSLSTTLSDHQQTPQPALKRRKYAEPPIWARRESEGNHHEVKRGENAGGAHVKRESTQGAAPGPQQTTPAMAPRPSPQQGTSAPPMQSPQIQSRSAHWEPSLENIEPYNSITRVVGDWLWDLVIDAPDYGPETHIEIEAKIGTLIDPSSQHQRFGELEVRTEAVLAQEMRRKPRFESLMSMMQHRSLNNYLNQTVKASKLPGREAVHYKRIREVDTFYDLPPPFLAQLHPAIQKVQSAAKRGPRVRLTTDQKTNAPTATIIKSRLADLEVYCPNDAFDYRISVSLETKYPHPIDGLNEHLDRGVSTARAKDRLSYIHQGFQVDLTQVTMLSNPSEKVHELEVELDTELLRAEADKVKRGEPNEYERLVGIFLNNVRVINRAAVVQ